MRIDLLEAFTGRTLWDKQMTDTDYDKVICETIDLSVKWGLIEKTAKDQLIPTPLGKNTGYKKNIISTLSTLLASHALRHFIKDLRSLSSKIL